MGLSLTYLSLVILFNSFFMSNFLLIRALRRHMDATYQQRHDKENGDDNSDSVGRRPQASFQDKINQSALLSFFIGPPYAIYRMLQAKFQQHESAEGEQRNSKLDIMIAFLFGFARKKKYESKQFPKWDPLPYKLGASTTTFLIVLFGIVFSDVVLNNIFGLDPTSTSPMGGVCTDEGMKEKVGAIHSKLVHRSNLAGAIAQTQLSNAFLRALQDDTSLWGESGYECQNSNITKAEFQRHEYGGYDFFPGVCFAAQESALEVARNQTCMKEFCNFGSIIDPESIVPQNGEIINLDVVEKKLENLKDNIGDLEAVCKNCPGNNLIENIGFAFDFMFSNKSPKAEIEGLGKVDESFAGVHSSLNDVNITAPSVTFGYMDEAFCGQHRILCPDYSKKPMEFYREVSCSSRMKSKSWNRIVPRTGTMTSDQASCSILYHSKVTFLNKN